MEIALSNGTTGSYHHITIFFFFFNTNPNFPTKHHSYISHFPLSNRKHLMGLSNLLTLPSLNYSIPE